MEMNAQKALALAGSLRDMAANRHIPQRYAERLVEAADAITALQSAVPKANSTRIYHAVLKSPGSSDEIAAELGMPMRSVSSVLSRLHAKGLIGRSKQKAPKAGCAGAYIYGRRQA